MVHSGCQILRDRINSDSGLRDHILAAAIEQRPPKPYIGTHRVHQFSYSGEQVIWKQARKVAPIQNLVYAAQDWGFLGSRSFHETGLSMLKQEAKKLVALEDSVVQLAPYLYQFYSDQPALFKSYIGGTSFREMGLSTQKESIPHIVELVKRIHGEGIAIGDAHIKNAIRRVEDDAMLWLDFDGVFDEADLNVAKARDLVKLTYSTFTATRNRRLTLQIAETLADYGGYYVKQAAIELMNNKSWSPILWYATRVSPADHKEISAELLRSLRFNYFNPSRKD